MLRGEIVALLVSAVYAFALVCERVPRVRALRAWPVLRELVPIMSAALGLLCAAHWFTSASEIRPPRILTCLLVSIGFSLPVAAVTNARARRVVAGTMIAFMSFLALADALYFRFFGGLLPLLGSANVKQAWEVTSSIVALLMFRDLAFVALMASGVWFATSRPFSPSIDHRPVQKRVFRWALAASAAGILFLAVDVAGWLSVTHSSKILSWRQRMHETGIFGSHVRDVARTVKARVETGDPSPERIQALAKYLESTRVLVPDELFGVARGKSLVLLQVEALQQWVIDARVHGVEITPFLNRLKRERGMYFSGVWDQTLISPTADSEYLTLNSLHPLPDAAIAFRFSGNDFVALPGILARQGYSTFSAHGYERGFWNRAIVHPRYGFQRSFFDRELGATPKIGWGLADKVFLMRALERIDATRAPFLAFMITLTSHHPYGYLPPEERRIDTHGLPEMLAGYVASMRYVDEALAGFFAAFAKRPYAKDTVVAMYGDHESRIALDQAAETQAREALSLDAQTVKDLARRAFSTRKIPLLVVLPDAREARVFEQVGGQIDISPTLLHLLGLPKPKSMMGTALVGKGGAVFRGEGSAVEGERVRLADGNCRTLRGQGLPVRECEDLSRRGDVELQVSWAITQYNLAERLSSERRAAR